MQIKLMPMLAGAIVFGAIATPFALNAQANPSAQPLLAQAQQHQSKWSQLNLPEQQQQQKVQAAMQNGQGRNNQAWREVMASLTDEQKAKKRELMQQQKSRFEAILTAEQKQQLEQMHQEWKQK